MRLEQDARAVGLTLNYNKCEVIGSPETIAAWNIFGLAFAGPR
jgi:hypothetical protein